MNRFCSLSAAAIAVTASSVATAAPRLRMTVSAEQAEAGEAIRVEISAMSDGEEPSNPRLRVPPGFTVEGPSVSSSQSFSLTNGHFEHQRGITATWLVVAPHAGRYVIGPATVQFGPKTESSDTANVEVVASGTLPKRPRANPTDPFDLDPFFSHMPKLPGFRGIPGMPNLDDLEDQLHALTPEPPPDYAVDHAPDQAAFLRATASPTDAVVGQQVTLRVYAYAANGPYDEVGAAEPSRPDFLSQSIIDSSYRQQRYLTEIDGSRFVVVKLREVALFPLHAGDLTIGPMKMGFRGPGYPESSPMQGLVRASKELHVTVREPPIAGRPPGYELGDVGTYTLSSEVEPRSVVAGDAIAVTVRLEGTGNVPHAVKVPEQKGVDWLDPTITDQVDAHDGVVGGSRTFRYVVRLDEPGTHDLGEVTLPYYDPKVRRYDVARTALGSVEVKPGKAIAPAPSAASSAAPSEGPLEDIGPPRRALGASPAAPRHLTDSKNFFGLLAGAPLAVVALGGLAELAGRLRRRLAARGQSLSAASRKALLDARAAAARRDQAGVAGAVERAVYLSIEDKLGLKARAVLRADLDRKLEKAGAERAVASELVDVLDACDKLRFSTGDASDAGSVIERASRAIARLPRASVRAASEQAA
ncbi:MAG TPA: BatD family protein [Polyangiaceae bacterium]|nr:BatD family protein [Polyangiaceae bacterium]